MIPIFEGYIVLGYHILCHRGIAISQSQTMEQRRQRAIPANVIDNVSTVSFSVWPMSCLAATPAS